MGNGVKFFNKEDPILYKIKDLIRIIMFIGLVVGAIYIKPMKAKDAELEQADEQFKIELTKTNDNVKTLEVGQAILRTRSDQTIEILKEIKDDMKWLVRERKK